MVKHVGVGRLVDGPLLVRFHRLIVIHDAKIRLATNKNKKRKNTKNALASEMCRTDAERQSETTRRMRGRARSPERQRTNAVRENRRVGTRTVHGDYGVAFCVQDSEPQRRTTDVLIVRYRRTATPSAL